MSQVGLSKTYIDISDVKNKISFDVGLTRRLNKIHKSLPSSEVAYWKGLLSGISYEGSFIHYLNQQYGLGLIVNHSISSNSVTDIFVEDIDGSGTGLDAFKSQSDNITLTYIAPMFSYRFTNLHSKTALYTNASLGYLLYHQRGLIKYTPNKGNATSFSTKIVGNSFGTSASFGIDYSIVQRLSLGAKISLFSGLLKRIKKDDIKIDLQKDYYEGLNRLNLSAGLRYNW